MSKKEKYVSDNSDQSDNDNSEDDRKYNDKSDEEETSEEKENMTYDEWCTFFKEEFEAAFYEHFGSKPNSFESALQQFIDDIQDWEHRSPMPN